MFKSNSYLIIFLIAFSQMFASGNKKHNLFPNGDLENIFINQIVQEKDRGSHIIATGEGVPTFWNLTEGAIICKKEKHSGNNSLKLISGEKEVRATVLTNFWTVKDGSMPFGMPLVANKPITVSFYYKTKEISNSKTLRAIIKLGAIKDLSTREDTIELEPTNDWKLVEREISLDKLLWGGKIIFTMADSTEGTAWIDDAYLGQDIGNGINLVKNHSFEEGIKGEEEDDDDYSCLPKGWKIPLEDQWVSWVGARYRNPEVDENESIGGKKCLRASVTYADGSGVSQIIPLHQKEIKPVAIDLWSKLDNSIGNLRPGYWGPDNYANMTIFIYHYDGTMQEVNPTLCLGESDHDWDYRRFGFQSTKPIKEILLQITVLGSEPTTSLYVDEVRAYEIGTSSEELEKRGIDYPRKSITSEWGNPEEEIKGIEVNNDNEKLYIRIPKKGNDEEISIYLNTQTESRFVNHYRYLYDVIKIDKKGNVYKGITVEKQGYTADGEFQDSKEFGIEKKGKDGGCILEIPLKSLQSNPLTKDAPFGFNIKWTDGSNVEYWSGKSANNKNMGRLILARKPVIRIKSIEFGKRYYYDKDQSQDFISHPQLYAGRNEAIIDVENFGEEGKIEIEVGIEGEKETSKTVEIKKGETKRIILPYEAGLNKLTEFEISITKNRITEVEESYPIVVSPAIEIVPDQEYYYSEEGKAAVEINNRYRPIQKKGKVEVEVKDLLEGKVIDSITKTNIKSVDTLEIDISGYRVNELPVQDYEIVVTYYDNEGKELGKSSKKFGKINHTVRRKLPPIEKLSVDDKGRIIINDNFRFFPIVPSVSVTEWDEAINLGANIYRSWYSKNRSPFEDTKRAWEKNVYTLTIGPSPDIVDQYRDEVDSLYSQPGFFSCYAKQFYYWNLPPEYVEYRKNVEKINMNSSSTRLIIWGHHDSSFLYDVDMPEWQIFNPLVGYCYVKIMGRPGSVWRNSPFLTKTEMVLNPHRFKLAEVNYYVTWHSDEVVPENFPGMLSLRGDDWHGVRNETYQAIIDGAHGVYTWLCMQKKDFQRLRGYYQELNYMWPIYVADDAENKVEIIPSQSTIDVRLKKYEGKYYLLTANRDETSKTVSIRIDGFNGMKVKKLFELKNELSVKDNVIRDTWNKYDVHVYEIEF